MLVCVNEEIEAYHILLDFFVLGRKLLPFKIRYYLPGDQLQHTQRVGVKAVVCSLAPLAILPAMFQIDIPDWIRESYEPYWLPNVPPRGDKMKVTNMAFSSLCCRYWEEESGQEFWECGWIASSNRRYDVN